MFQPFEQWLGHEGQILRLQSVHDEVPQMAGLGPVRLLRQPSGEIPQNEGDGDDVGVLPRPACEMGQPLFPRLQGVYGEAKRQVREKRRLAGTRITQKDHMALAYDSLERPERARLTCCIR